MGRRIAIFFKSIAVRHQFPRAAKRGGFKRGGGFPDLDLWKTARKTTKKARISSACRTPKILGQEGKNAQNCKEFLEKEKGKENQKDKEKKIRVKGGGFQTGGFPDLDLSFLFCPFWDFPDFSGIFPISSGDSPGIFRIRPFSLSRPIKSTYEEQSRKGPRRNLDLSRKKVGNPPVWKPPGLASLKILILLGAKARPSRGFSDFF